ncbi:MAG TPA: sulfite exporter TauE/SafE family protein [Pantanalinema sp.]
MSFDLWILLASVVAGAVAAVSGFGIGSMLTPLLALQMDTKLAVAAVSIPHAAATAYRFWILRAHLDRRVLAGFGASSAAGGLTGALLHAYAPGQALTLVFGGLLVFVGLSGLSGLAERLAFRGPWAWGAGALSGLLGGLVGNQGGIRSAALLGFDVPKEAFVATATAVGLLVDGARLPVYLVTQGDQLAGQWPSIAIATAGALVGTCVGNRVLRRIPEAVYRPLVSGVVLVLGLYMLARGLL